MDFSKRTPRDSCNRAMSRDKSQRCIRVCQAACNARYESAPDRRSAHANGRRIPLRDSLALSKRANSIGQWAPGLMWLRSETLSLSRMAVNGPTFCADGIFGEPHVRTRAVTLCPLSIACAVTCCPVRPVAPTINRFMEVSFRTRG